MKYVSCRQNFDQVDGAPVANQAWFGKPLIESKELLMVHGYNCVAEDTRDAYRANAEIARETGISSPLVGYLWPGLYGPVEKVEFHRAQAQADLSAVLLAQYLASAVGLPINVMTHSLGAKVALEAITKHGAKVGNLFLTGPAVAHDCFLTDYAKVYESVKRVYVFWSERDNVLGQAFMLDQFTQALGHDGPSTSLPWVVSVDCTDQVASHGQYRFDRAIWKAIAAAA